MDQDDIKHVMNNLIRPASSFQWYNATFLGSTFSPDMLRSRTASSIFFYHHFIDLFNLDCYTRIPGTYQFVHHISFNDVLLWPSEILEYRYLVCPSHGSAFDRLHNQQITSSASISDLLRSWCLRFAVVVLLSKLLLFWLCFFWLLLVPLHLPLLSCLLLRLETTIVVGTCRFEVEVIVIATATATTIIIIARTPLLRQHPTTTTTTTCLRFPNYVFKCNIVVDEVRRPDREYVVGHHEDGPRLEDLLHEE